MSKVNLAHSVRQRLLNLSRKGNEDYNLVLIRYAIERLLYRIAKSRYRDEFILKGAMLFSVWASKPYRSTKDLDLLGAGDSSGESVKSVFREICGLQVEPDGLEYDASSIEITDIREEEEYQGKRVFLLARLEKARMRLQIDIGFGDIVVPEAREINYPTLLNFPSPNIRAYPPETFVAEKLQAIISLGMTNSRMKDYYDLWIVCRKFEFVGLELVKAITSTFSRRNTNIPSSLPVGLTKDFAGDDGVKTRWEAFLNKGDLSEKQMDLPEVIRDIVIFVSEPLFAAADRKSLDKSWSAGGPWK